jgi:hypothetical protein
LVSYVKEEHTLKVFVRRDLRIVSGPKRDEMEE